MDLSEFLPIVSVVISAHVQRKCEKITKILHCHNLSVCIGHLLRRELWY